MRVYIAAAIESTERVRAYMRVIQAAGHEITYDWTSHGRVRGEASRLAQLAHDELTLGVGRAQAVVGLLPAGRGTHAELGYAAGCGKPILFIAPDEALFDPTRRQTTIVYHHESVTQSFSTSSNLCKTKNGGAHDETNPFVIRNWHSCRSYSCSLGGEI